MAMILVADDNDDNRVVLQRMLELGGHQATLAHNGQEAIAIASALKPDLILMDLAMPGMDGWEATARLKRLPEIRHIPVIVVTGHVTSDQIHRAGDAGCDDLVSKPVDFHVLLEKVNHFLNDGDNSSLPEALRPPVRNPVDACA